MGSYVGRCASSSCLVVFKNKEPPLKCVYEEISALKIRVRRPHTTEYGLAAFGVVLGVNYVGITGQ